MKSEEETKRIIAKRDGLKCHATGQKVEGVDDLNLLKTKNKYIQHFDESGAIVYDPDDFVLVHKDLGLEGSSGPSARFKILERELENRIKELETKERLTFERERTYREQVEFQRKELETLRETLILEQQSRDLKLREREEHLLEEFRKKESALLGDINLERRVLNEKREFIEKEKEKLEVKVLEHKAIMAAEFSDLEREKEKYKQETRKNIELRSGEYVNESIISLDAAAKKYHSISRNWSIAGTVSLILGVATGIFFGVKGLSPLEGKEIVEWSQVVFYAFKGVIVIGLFVALSKYCFIYGQSFMHESIKNGERKHAINFGKFYLQSYGVDAQWSQVKEAFEHWNINSASAFSGHDPDKFDPKMMDKALQFAESFQKISQPKRQDPPPTV